MHLNARHHEPSYSCVLLSNRNSLPVHRHVFQRQPRDVLRHRGLRGVFKGAILQPDVGNWSVLETAQRPRVGALLDVQVHYFDIAHHRSERPLGALLVIEIDVDGGCRHLAALHVAHVDVLDHAAADRVVLEAQHAVQVRAVHLAILREHVADVAGAFAAHGDTTVAVLHDAVLHDEVLAGRGHSTAIGVAPALDGDAIVAGIEGAAVDQYVDARFGVAAIVVGTVAGDGHVAHRDVLAEHRVHFIHRRVDDGDVLNLHVGATVGLHEHGPQVAAVAEYSFRDGCPLLPHLAQGGPGLGLILVVRPSLSGPRPPVLGVRLAVQGAAAGDPDILLVQRVNEGRVVHALQPLKAREHDGVELRVGVEPDGRALLHHQVHVALEVDGAGQADALSDHHVAAARTVGFLDGMAESFRAIRLAVRFGAVTGHLEFPGGELRRLNSFHDLGIERNPGIVGGPCAGTGESGSGHGCEGMAACVSRHLNRWYGRAVPASRGESFSGAKHTVFGISHAQLNYNLGISHHAYPGKILPRRRGPF